MHRLPAVRMARTKQTARKSRDDRQEEDRRCDRDRSDSPPERGRRRSPLPQKYVCIFCRKVNNQRTNHKRHLVMQHSCRLDGTPATEADFAQARRWSAKEPTGRSSRYKTQEFVESDSGDDTTQASSASTPSRRGSPSPPRGRRSKRTRSDSSASPSPRRAASLQQGSSQRPRSLTPPRSAPPAPKQAVKFDLNRRKPLNNRQEAILRRRVVKHRERPKAPLLRLKTGRKRRPTPDPLQRKQRLKRHRRL